MEGKRYFIAANHTGAGKTLVSALLVQGLGADYWKPVQAGQLDDSDTMWVQKMTTHPRSGIHPEKFRLKTPASPHYAAGLENIHISLADFLLPATENTLVIESAGGVFSPLSDELTALDLAEYFDAEMIFVSRHYLGSINHTLLSLEAIRRRNIPVCGIIFNGDDKTHEEWILKKTGLQRLGSLPEKGNITPESFPGFMEYIFWDVLI